MCGLLLPGFGGGLAGPAFFLLKLCWIQMRFQLHSLRPAGSPAYVSTRNVVVEDVTYSFRCQLGSPWSKYCNCTICLSLLPLDKFCPLPRLTGSRILCRIRSFQMSLPPISDALWGWVCRPWPLFPETKLSHTSVARFKDDSRHQRCRSRPRSPCFATWHDNIVAIPEFMEVPLLWLADGAITGSPFILTHKSARSLSLPDLCASIDDSHSSN